MMYAQTNIELYRQLIGQGYDDAALARVYRAYEYACSLFPCIYHRNGDTFVNHLVRTASILASLGASADIVIAGLLHSGYLHGNFGTLKNGMTNSKRRQMRSVAGETAEEYIAHYTRLDWIWQKIPDLQTRLNEVSAADRAAVLIRLVNELEEHLDLGIYYCANAEARLKGVEYLGDTFIRMANEMKYPSLAAELAQVFQETKSGTIPTYLRCRYESFYTVNPRTLSVDRLPLIWDMVSRKFQLVRSRVRLRTRLRHLFHSMRNSHPEQTVKT